MRRQKSPATQNLLNPEPRTFEPNIYVVNLDVGLEYKIKIRLCQNNRAS
jgi:hypothetical protein